jgi:CRP-like cAMP-binding protein
LPLFAPLPTFELEAVARSAVEVEVGTGEIVIREGESGDRFYAVSSGQFDVSVAGEHVVTAHRGSGFGEVALIANVARTATVIARQPGHLLAIDRSPFLVAVTGYDSSHRAAWDAVRAMTLDPEILDRDPHTDRS